MHRLENFIPVVVILCGYAISYYWARRCRVDKVTIQDILAINGICVVFALIIWAIQVLVNISEAVGN